MRGLPHWTSARDENAGDDDGSAALDGPGSPPPSRLAVSARRMQRGPRPAHRVIAHHLRRGTARRAAAEASLTAQAGLEERQYQRQRLEAIRRSGAAPPPLRPTEAALHFPSWRRRRSSRSRGGGEDYEAGDSNPLIVKTGLTSFFRSSPHGASAGGRTGGGAFARHSNRRPSASAPRLPHLGGSTSPLLSHVLDWRVPSLTAEQELLQHAFAAAYSDACYRCLISQDAAKFFGPNEALQLVVDRWRADAFAQSQQALQQVVEQYHHDLLQVVTAVIDAEDAALALLRGEAAASEESSSTSLLMHDVGSGAAGAAPASMLGSNPSDASFLKTVLHAGLASVPASIDCPAVSAAALHYATPALGRVLVYEGFFLCFWYSSTGERLGQLEYRACRWVLEAHVPQVHVPLCFHFRYKGRGVTAMSLVPVGKNLTTVTEQNPEVAALAQQLASVLSLLPYGTPLDRAHERASAATAAAAATSLGAARGRSSSAAASLSASFAATGADGEAMPDTCFLPRSVRAHFAQDGRYYFLRNHQWFAPWLNSRQSFDAASQRLCYVNPRLLAACGVQVSCRACQRDASLEESRLALEFMRREVDAGIPQLLHSERELQMRQTLRRRQRAAALHFRVRRALRAAEEVEARRQTTQVWMGAAEGTALATNSRLAVAEGDDAESPPGSERGDDEERTRDAGSDAEWEAASTGSSGGGGASDETSSSEDDDDGAAGDGAAAGLRGGLAGGRAHLPFATKSVVARFSARGYPKSFLGLLLLALLQYPAAPQSMLREVKRELLFRGLKAFILIRVYDARFGVEQLLARLPYERSTDSEALWDGADAAGTSESDDEYEPVYHEDPGTPRFADADAAAVPPSGRRTTTNSHSSSSPHRAPESPVVPIHATATSDGRTSTWLGSARPAAEAPLTPPFAAQTNPLLPALPVVLTPASSPNAEITATDEAAGEHGRASQTFAQRWREGGGGDGGVGDGGGEASGDIGEVRQEAGFDPPSPTAAAATEMEGRGWWVRVRARLVSMRVLWSGADTATSSSSSVANQSDASQPAVPNALQPHAGHADPAAGAQTEAAAAAPRRPYFGRGSGARGPQPRTERLSSLSSTPQGSPATGAAAPGGGSGSGAAAAAATATTTSWADFATATERVLAAFMQYDGTSHPAEVFCDSPRRLRAVQARETGLLSTPSNSNSQSATAGGGGSGFWQRQPQHQRQPPPSQRRGSGSSGGALFVEEELWSSADALSRLYTEHILPFIYRKFRLSVRRTRVLHEPLSEEDRAAVYVRVLAALGARVVDGEVRQVVPVVRDFTPLRSSTAATTSAATPPQPASRHGGVPVPDAVNHVNPLEGPPPPSPAAPVTPPLGCRRGSPSPEAAQLTSPLSIHTNDGESSTGGASGGRTAARPEGFMAPGAHSGPESPTSGQGRASVLAPVHAVVSPSDVAAAIARAVELPPLTQPSAACYVLPRWVAWRARALVRRFLNDGVTGPCYGRDAVALRTGRRALRSPSTAAAAAGRDVPPALASAAAAQAAGLVPLLNLLYRVPDSALATGVRRPDLPGWPETSARLLAHLRAASTAPHLVWDAMELYELAEINAQPWDGRLEGPSWSAAPASAPLLSARRSSALRARDGPLGAGLGVGAAEGGPLDAAVSDALAPATLPPPLLPPPESSLALALLYRRQTLRTPSDRAALIRVLQRRATAIGDNASLASSPAGPKREADTTAAAAGASAAEQAEKGADSSRSGGGERRRELPDVAAAVIPLLQEVLLNADHLLEHLGNPYGAQYRQHTVDLVRYLELTAQAVRSMSSQSTTGSERGQRSSTAAQVQAEEEAVLQHLWKHLATYCKPDFMAAKDALQRAVVLYHQHEGVASGTFTSLDSLTGGRRSSGGGWGGGAVAAAAPSTSWASTPSLELERDVAVEDALQRACELFAIADGPGSPLALRALSNQAMYWFTVGCFPKWRECVQLLRRRWRDGGPDDVRLLLLATLTANTSRPGGGGAASFNSSSFRAGTSMLEVHPAATARRGSVAARMTASLQGSESDLGSVAGAPICFLHRVKRE